VVEEQRALPGLAAGVQPSSRLRSAVAHGSAASSLIAVNLLLDVIQVITLVQGRSR